MDLYKHPVQLGSKVNRVQINDKGEAAIVSIAEQRNNIPDEIFLMPYKIDGVDRALNLRKLFEIDVTELSELTLDNLRIQLEQISSIRLTLARAYEQMMEDYNRFEISYDIWYANEMESSRERYWREQSVIQKTYDLAKSGMKPPTQDDLKNTMLRGVGSKVDYLDYQNKMVAYERAKSLFEKIDGILNSREYDLKTIIDMRGTRNEGGMKRG